MFSAYLDMKTTLFFLHQNLTCMKMTEAKFSSFSMSESLSELELLLLSEPMNKSLVVKAFHNHFISIVLYFLNNERKSEQAHIPKIQHCLTMLHIVNSNAMH